MPLLALLFAITIGVPLLFFFLFFFGIMALLHADMNVLTTVPVNEREYNLN